MYRTSLRRRRGVPIPGHARDLAWARHARPHVSPFPALGLALMLWLASASVAHSAPGVYVVDPANPSSSDSGPGDFAQPYRSITAAVNAQFGPDVVIIVRPGVYREKVVIGGSGRTGHPYVLRADGHVVIDGADDLSAPAAWLPYANGVWRAPQVTWRPVQVFVDGVRLQPSTSAPEALTPGTFRQVTGGGLFVNLGADPSGHAIAVGARSHGIQILGRTSVRVEGFEIARAETKGIEVALYSHNVQIENNVVTQAGSAGIGLLQCDGVLVRGNRVSGCNHHGIELRLGVTGAMIVGNESSENARAGESWANGIYLSESSNNLILRNDVHHNQDTGIEIQTGSNDNRLMQNRSWANGDHGFEHLFATGTLSEGNVAWGNAHDGFSVEGSATGTRLYNCIAAENGPGGTGYDLYVDSSSVAGFDADHLLLWKSDGSPSVKFDRTTYATVAAFLAARGIAPHTVNADPRFASPATGDFHLLAGSGAIDAADSGAPYWPGTDVDGRGPADDPSTPDTGSGPVTYADLGAYEFAGVTLGVGDPAAGSGALSVRVAPNPARSAVAFTRRGGDAGAARAQVFDVAGREVWSGAFAAGSSELRWDLRDRSGSRVRSGLYLARVGGGSAQVVRVVVLD